MSVKRNAMNRVIIDIMLRDRFFATIRIEPELNMITEFYGDKPVVSVNALCKVVEERRPTLKGKAYKILPCNDKLVFNYDLI